jgi:hypothetical protein
MKKAQVRDLGPFAVQCDHSPRARSVPERFSAAFRAASSRAFRTVASRPAAASSRWRGEHVPGVPEVVEPEVLGQADGLTRLSPRPPGGAAPEGSALLPVPLTRPAVVSPEGDRGVDPLPARGGLQTASPCDHQRTVYARDAQPLDQKLCTPPAAGRLGGGAIAGWERPPGRGSRRFSPREGRRQRRTGAETGRPVAEVRISRRGRGSPRRERGKSSTGGCRCRPRAGRPPTQAS